MGLNGEGLKADAHREGEATSDAVLDTYGGRVHVRWDEQAPVTALGHVPFFIEFLKTSGLYDTWVDDCPLKYTSPNAPAKADVLGTLLLSILAGHRRYAHVSAVRCDGVNPQLLGMSRVLSEDSIRRSFKNQSPEECREWMDKHLRNCWSALLDRPWILDLDTSIKTLYGNQEGAAIGYNPKKPNRNSHVYHILVASPLRLVLDVDVQPGTNATAAHTSPGLWKLLDGLDRSLWPKLLRGDCLFGTDQLMRDAEARQLDYLLKLRKTAGVKKVIEKLFKSSDWVRFDSNCEAHEAEVCLAGWQSSRRLVVVRRKIENSIVVKRNTGQTELFGNDNSVRYEYAILITSLNCGLEQVVDLYRHRANVENAFDELKNQWAWSGYVTQDLHRCKVMARTTALIYNWWTLYTRFVTGDNHREAITSRPELMHAVARQTNHARQATLTITSTHAKALKIKALLIAANQFLASLRTTAEQLTKAQRWKAIVGRILDQLTAEIWSKMLKLPAERAT